MGDVWFRRKIYGWGWVPVTWQGWVLTAFYAGMLIFLFERAESILSGNEVLVDLILPVFFFTALFIAIAYKKGESPRWQWGGKK